MRIVLFGQAAFGQKVLEALVERGEEIVAVYTPPDSPSRADPLKEKALELGIPVYQPKRLRDPEVYEEYKNLKADLNVMAFVTDIMPKSILNYPKYGTIMYHPSLLPRHRGGSAINWAVINGEAKTGVSIVWPDRCLDTGPILLQKEVEIAPDDTVGSLYFNKLFPLGVEAIVESVELIRQGKASRIPQKDSQATYEKLCTEEDAVIDWNKPSAKIYNLIRGTNPQPGASTMYGVLTLKIFDSELLARKARRQPGEVADVSDKAFVVAGHDGSILVKRVQVKGSPKASAAEFARQVGLKPGDRLGE
jgi:methionyl-tRNA formyltransferase